jgi:AmmeMemoRadiSam system protein A
MLTGYEKILLKIARDAIKERLTGKTLIDRDRIIEQYPELTEPGAVFVTLNKNHQLRGCIGSIEAHRPLIDDIIGNARSAAFSDPRFNTLEPDEFENISIEISILSKPEPVFYNSVEELKELIKPYTDGIILTKGFRKAVFLPQVWEQLPDFDSFFEHLCKKARLYSNCLYDHPDISKFNVTIIEEE